MMRRTCRAIARRDGRRNGSVDMDYQSENAQTIDRWVDEGWQWGVPISHDAFVDAQHGSWDILLTPTKPVPHEWVGDVRGKRVLGLASGGAQQMPVMAALGAQCTVLDYSSRQCEREYEVADREGYDIEVIQADMTQPLPFEDESFDLIINPVSNCYIEQVKPVFRECYRVLKPGGSLIGGYDNGINYIFDNEETTLTYALPFNPLHDERARQMLLDEDAGMQFSHTLDEQIGGQLEAGFTLRALYEDTNGEGNLHEHHVPTFVATWSVKPVQ